MQGPAHSGIHGTPAARERGVALYDADCPFCVGRVARWGAVFTRRGYRWLPLQTPGTAKRLGLTELALHEEMKLALPDGMVVGGVDAWVRMMRSVWWLWPLGFLLAAPGVHWLGTRGYRWLARHRRCLGGACAWQGSRARRRTIPFLDLP